MSTQEEQLIELMLTLKVNPNHGHNDDDDENSFVGYDRTRRRTRLVAFLHPHLRLRTH
ncbi:hypothetical protein PISMIDRAFT_671671 [Pisolithus microcarpus 441]|uniref:Uncharacterized protein n=1 Tax=Pisolithus microcarpus 441 TaxID=765257 RepID=A0A0D0A5M6_9AGAM|nr:hypothetical protein PISMIDRAFT_671671 [Pisolithus microcarpus 441]